MSIQPGKLKIWQMKASHEDGLSLCTPASKETNFIPSPNDTLEACLIGIGEESQTLASLLVSSYHSNTLTSGMENPIEVNVTGLTHFDQLCVEIDPYIIGKLMIFIIDSNDDTAFWTVRELVSRHNPVLLIRIGSFYPVKDQNIKPNEGVFLFHDSQEMKIATVLVWQLFRLFYFYSSLFCIDITDVKEVLGGAVLTLLTFKMHQERDWNGFELFLEENGGIISRSDSLLMIMNSDDPSMADFETSFAMVQRIFPEERPASFGTHHDKNLPGLEIVLLLANRSSTCGVSPIPRSKGKGKGSLPKGSMPKWLKRLWQAEFSK